MSGPAWADHDDNLQGRNHVEAFVHAESQSSLRPLSRPGRPEPRAGADLCVGSKPGCFSTIQAAVDAAQDGDTIKVGRGHVRGRDHDRRERPARGGGRARDDHRGRRPRASRSGQHLAPDPPTVSIRGVTITGGEVNEESRRQVRHTRRRRLHRDRRELRSRGNGHDRRQRHHRQPYVAGGGRSRRRPSRSPRGPGSTTSATSRSSTRRSRTTMQARHQGGPRSRPNATAGGIYNHIQAALTLERSVVSGNPHAWPRRTTVRRTPVGSSPSAS